MRCITVDVNEGEIAALVARGYLPEEARGDPVAIKAAIEIVISDLAFELEQERSKGAELASEMVWGSFLHRGTAPLLLRR